MPEGQMLPAGRRGTVRGEVAEMERRWVGLLAVVPVGPSSPEWVRWTAEEKGATSDLREGMVEPELLLLVVAVLLKAIISLELEESSFTTREGRESTL